jgi:GNAT superfamily N-acetyltransferase
VSLSAPALLAEHHERDEFNSGEASLDDWLKKRARANQLSGASRVFVTCESETNRVAGYYSLSSSNIVPEIVPGRFRRNMPDPIPVVLLGRLAIDKQWQAKGIGRSLFRDAAMRVSQAAEAIGVRGIVVHAISDEARKFYLGIGFSECPHEPMTLVVTLQEIRAALGV